MNNLAADPDYAQRLEAMRKALKAHMVEARDTSIIAESMFEPLAGDRPVSAYLASRSKDLPALVELAFAASSADPGALPTLMTALGSEDPVTRYWAAHGCTVLGENAKAAQQRLLELTKDPFAGIRVSAAHALHRMGHDSTPLLLAELNNDSPDMAKLAAINSLRALSLDDRIPDAVARQLATSSNEYVQRFAKELVK